MLCLHQAPTSPCDLDMLTIWEQSLIKMGNLHYEVWVAPAALMDAGHGWSLPHAVAVTQSTYATAIISRCCWYERLFEGWHHTSACILLFGKRKCSGIIQNRQKKCTEFVLHWVSPETDSETKMWLQGVYVKGDPRKYQWKHEDVRQGMDEAQSVWAAGLRPPGAFLEMTD